MLNDCPEVVADLQLGEAMGQLRAMAVVPLDPGRQMLLGRQVVGLGVVAGAVGQDEVVPEVGG